ncbi:GcvT family protein [Roseovarius pelagicus]|uniref:FAD-dependent oxidoreductase n=1 Tax=Roseovarius pelagicus TaxID=2980108 RepID=A0ABY6D8Z6_9RHOB|nr:FAD-dependent oxidoreductase [Roseovarius pelagicus]UXX82553.1 FAD-dependent oxidoreductase [Roseovarius pelagicus]
MKNIIIIGGGAIGLSLAYHLAGRAHVTLLERNQLTSGTSWHAAGIVGPLRASANMTKLAMYAGELFPKLEEETGLSTGYRQTGGYWLAREDARMDELHRIAALGRHFGLGASIIAPDDIGLPSMNADGLVGALRVEQDANVNPVDLCMAYAKAARAKGAVIREEVRVASLLIENGTAKGVTLEDGTEMLADSVALCAGAWSKKLADAAGVALPLQAVEHMYVVTEPMSDLPAPYPVLRDLDRGFYVKGDAGKLVIGGFEPDAKVWDAFGPEGDRPFLEMPEDWDQFLPFMEGALDLIPALVDTGIQHFMNGPESFTNDTRPYIGQTPNVDGLFVAAGMNSVGVMSSAGIGHVLSDWMVNDTAPVDLWEVDVARVDPLTAAASHIESRMKEAVADSFSLHWPFKQPKAGRGLRKSALHDHWRVAGAQFGLTAGWERGLWYAQDEAEMGLPYSVGDQSWYPIIRREAAQMSDGAALVDLSPFGKYEIEGPDALSLLQSLACANVDMENGCAVYTPLLNAKGGIEADVTIARITEARFRMTSAAALRQKDLAWLRRHSAGLNVSVTDRTEDEVVIGVMGAGARAALAALSDDDWHNFPFSTRKDVTVAGVAMTALRVSFVGELGWELYISADQGGPVFDALYRNGARPLGFYALDGCRIEKGFKHWGHDLSTDITPLEAGLGFTIDWTKSFIGKEALLAQKAHGLMRRQVMFDLPTHPLVLHDEPVWEKGRIVGLTTSGARGARTGRTLALAMIDIAPGEKLTESQTRHFEIEIAGQRHPANLLMRPPFDPTGERMRG